MSENRTMTQQESTNKSNQNSHAILGHEISQSEGKYEEQQNTGVLHRLLADPFSASLKRTCCHCSQY